MSHSPSSSPYTAPLSTGELKALLSSAQEALKAGAIEQGRSAVWSALRERPLSPSDVERVGRWLRKWRSATQPPTLSVRVLGQWTSAWLSRALEVEAWVRGVDLEVSEGSYDQVLQDSFQPVEADIVALLPWGDRLLSQPTQEGIDAELGYWQQVWLNLAQSPAAKQRGVKLLQVGYDLPMTGPQGSALGGQAYGALDLFRRVNQGLRDALPQGSYFADLSHLAAELGRRSFYDARQYHWTKQPLSRAGLQSLAELLWAGCRALTTGPKKVLVLDLDNTLWGGVVGDEGPLGVSVGGDAEGEAFLAFQRYCKALSERGVVLAVASKNHLEDAQAPFKERPDMALKLSDFAAFEAHWSSKAVSLKRIAETLKLGLDSFVFFDDHPVERAVIRDLLPEVEVVDVPTEPALYIEALERGRWFEATQMTQEDLARAAQYQQEQARRAHNAQFNSLEDYLSTLEMRAELRELSELDLPRVSQLIAKTNQFNLTTRRHSPAYVSELRAQERALLYTLRLSDRFGDYGLISVILASPHPERPERLVIDTWLMSCRVIGRTVEQLFFAQLVERALSAGYSELEATYCPTRKNSLIEGLLPSLGGELITSQEGEDKRYLFHLKGLELPTYFVSLA